MAEKLEVTVVATSKRLSEPCPLPTVSERTKEILAGGIKGDNTVLLREAATFYEGICPRPTSDEYLTMANFSSNTLN